MSLAARPRPVVLALASALVLAVQSGAPSEAGGATPTVPRTVVSIADGEFRINGGVTHRGSPAEGMLLNSRMIQAVFDDENHETVARWRYPDTRRWSAERNTREFVAALPAYAAWGLRAVTIGLQGGSPRAEDWFRGNHQRPIVSAFRPDGSIKPAWLRRLDRVIRAAGRRRIVVIVSLFYFGQDHRLRDERAVVRAVDGTTDFLVRGRYTNVLVEIANESDLFYEHPILQPNRVGELVRRVQRRSRGRLAVSTSFTSGHIPSNEIVAVSDYVLLHGNSQDPSGITRLVESVRKRPAYAAAPKPIVFNEDSTSIAKMQAAVGARASWGYYDRGTNDYVNGFQSPPVNWSVNTPAKRQFFAEVRRLTRSRRSDE